MFLAFKLKDLITIPFGYLLDFLYGLFGNYGMALIFFAIAVQLVLLPISAKSKKSMMKMSRLSPRLEAIKARYPDDQVKQNEAMQALYREEGVGMGMGGCLWSLVPMLILIPLYSVVRQPITYMLHETVETATEIVKVIKAAAPTYFVEGRDFYDEMVAAQLIPQFVEELKAAGLSLNANTLEGVNFNFLGIDFSSVAQFNVFGWSAFDWAHIGAFLVPVLSAGSQVLSMWVSTKLNNSVITNEKGIVDEEEAKKSQANQTSKTMMWMMPIMSLFIGFTVPAAMSLYWFIQGIVSLAGDVYLTKKYRKIYDAEDAIRLQKALEEDRIAAEKERLRAERRAANPDGITENTSKKKLQQKQQREAEAAKAAAAKEYAMKKGLVDEEEVAEKTTLSGIPSRPYCKGRAYDPNRYSTESTEE